MNGIRRLTEPLMRPIFKYGIERSSKGWVQRNDVDTESQEYRDHVQTVYEHEMGTFWKRRWAGTLSSA